MRVWIQRSLTNTPRFGKSIEVDKNLLAVLKNSSGMNIPGQEIPEDDLASINKLEEKIKADETRLNEINEKFSNRRHESPATNANGWIGKNIYIVFLHCYNAVHLYMFRGS